MPTSENPVQTAVDAINTDIHIDDKIIDAARPIDWHQVTESEAASFGLALGLYRDVVQTREKRRVAYGTATGTVLSICVLAVACTLVHAEPLFTLSVVMATQAVRAGWLWFKYLQANADVGLMKQQAVEVAQDIAELHPARTSMETDTYPSEPSPATR